MLTLTNISKTFTTAQGTLLAVDSIDFTVADGEFVCLVGPSGCGKSTILRLISGLEKPTSGHLKLEGDPAIVFQQFALFPWLTVAENIAFPLKMAGRVDHKKVAELISEMGLRGFEDKHPKELSGGMKQRVGIARALSVDPQVLLLDEPFSALDTFTAKTLRQELLKVWLARKMTILMVTHLVEEAVELADKILVMSPRPGKIIKTFDTKLARPRNVRSPAFFKLVDEIDTSITIGHA